MELYVHCEDAAGGLDELAEWLGAETRLRGWVTRGSRTPAPDTLGADDVLVVAVGSGGALSVLTASLKTFLSLPRRSDIRIVVTSKDGSKVEVDAKRVADVEALMRATFGREE